MKGYVECVGYHIIYQTYYIHPAHKPCNLLAMKKRRIRISASTAVNVK
jgi:hypothetical protein